jgi:5-methylcytosine-specific restriction protein A
VINLNLQRSLEQLRPHARHPVMDLVSQAGIDVSAWALKVDPKNPGRTIPVVQPRANPKYCYEWAFGDESQGYVLCVWHASLKVVQLPTGPAIVYEENIRELALSLDRIAIDRSRETGERNRARDQARRARAFDVALQRAFHKSVPVQLIINEGDRRPLEELGKSKSTVKLRKLDTEPWFVHSYKDGLPLLVRALPGPDLEGATPSLVEATAPASTVVTEPAAPAAQHPQLANQSPVLVDQFSAMLPATTHDATVTLRDRSPAVRDHVLRRAAGHCEWCGRAGFVTASGAIYLETHHITPLAKDGPDHSSNVIALCPEDHRRAHYAKDHEDLAKLLAAKVQAME